MSHERPYNRPHEEAAAKLLASVELARLRPLYVVDWPAIVVLLGLVDLLCIGSLLSEAISVGLKSGWFLGLALLPAGMAAAFFYFEPLKRRI